MKKEMQVQMEMRMEIDILATLPMPAKQAVGRRRRYYSFLLFDTDKHDMTLWPLSSWLLNYLLNKDHDPLFYFRELLSPSASETDKKVERVRDSQTW